MTTKLMVKKVRDGAVLPAYSSEDAAGLDLYACLQAPLDLAPGTVTVIPSGIAVAIPSGYVGLVRDRSSMALKGIHTVAGVIDADYRGEIMVAVHCASPTSFTIQPRDRVAQMLILPCPQVEVAEATDLPATGRGAGGFGSTGR